MSILLINFGVSSLNSKLIPRLQISFRELFLNHLSWCRLDVSKKFSKLIFLEKAVWKCARNKKFYFDIIWTNEISLLRGIIQFGSSRFDFFSIFTTVFHAINLVAKVVLLKPSPRTQINKNGSLLGYFQTTIYHWNRALLGT